MKKRLRLILEWALLATLIGGTGLAVARAQPVDSAPQFVKFEPIIVPVFIDNRSAGLLSVQVYLEAPNSATRATLERRRPHLVDAYTDALIRHARLYVDPAQPINVDAVAAKIDAATAMASDGNAARVLILEAMARPT